MIYLDTNIFVYAVGRPHPLRDEVRGRLAATTSPLLTSAEVVQELLHIFLPVGRELELDAALQMASDLVSVIDTTADDVLAARSLARTTPSSRRDLIHLALALRHGADDLWTYDRALGAAWTRRSR